MQVVHFIPGLGSGGAEKMLYNIIKFHKNPNIEYSIITLKKGDYYSEKIKKLNIPIIEIPSNVYFIKDIKKLYYELKEKDILCCWMYHCNFLGIFLKKITKTKKIYWNIRHSSVNKKYDKSRTIIINKLCSYLSRKVDLILYNGKKARDVHEKIGYKNGSSFVVENGVDTKKYSQIRDAKKRLLSELRIDYQNKFVISSVARYHPVKDIPNFIEAISVVKKKYPNTIALLCGKGEDITNNELIKVIDGFHLELNKDIFLLGERNDLSMVYSASDLFILHSVSEASPNCLLEAMSCRTLCLATDVGNVRDLIEDKDLIVPPKEPMELATKIIKAIELSDKEKNRIKEANRIKIKQKYSIEKCVEIYEMFYEKNY